MRPAYWRASRDPRAVAPSLAKLGKRMHSKLRKLMPSRRAKLQVKPSRGDPSPYADPKWVEFRKELIKQRGRICEDPEHNPYQLSPSGQIYADHIVELKDGGAMFDPANVMLRCPSCHVRKTYRERGKRARRRYE